MTDNLWLLVAGVFCVSLIVSYLRAINENLQTLIRISEHEFSIG
jgi:hypothetical protein